jgi:quinolinate synthase
MMKANERGKMQNDTDKHLIDEINRLKKEKGAIILVHNYQRPEIYRIADFIGDSYGLSREASETKTRMIIFCGVHFMAESASILNPDKKVIIPAIDAGCPMADMVKAEDLRELKKKHPDAAVVCYINTTAEIKAESDIVCTSSNAVKIVNSLHHKRIVFVPDKNLADYVAGYTDKEIIPWNGYCYVHTKFSPEELAKSKKLRGDTKVIAHPECPAGVRALADHICSTSGMIGYAKQSDAKEFIIATEMGMIEMLRLQVPGKIFFSAPPGSTCVNMKKTNLRLVLEALENEAPIVTVPEKIRLKAKEALDRMVDTAK